MNLSCLTSIGVFTPAQQEALEKVVAQLPGSQTDLLKTLIGLMLININSPIPYPVLGWDSITIDNENPDTLAPPSGAKKAIITCYGNPVFFRVDGGIPSALNGHYMAVNSTFDITSLDNFIAVSVDDSAASTLFVTYY